MSSPRPWQLRSSSVVFRCPYFQVREDNVVNPLGRALSQFVVDHPGNPVAIVPVSPDDRLLFIAQSRYTTAQLSWEFPCGGMQSHESPESGAARELLEETGLAATSLHYLGRLQEANGFSSNLAIVYGARVNHAPVCPSGDEPIVEHAWWTHEEARERIARGIINDSLTVASFALATAMRWL